MKVLILAAGKGTRINTGFTVVPKPLYKVGRKSLIEHVIFGLKEAGIKDIIIVVGFMSEHIKDYLKDGSALGVSITYLYSEDYDKSEGFSILRGKELLFDQSFILSMADHVMEPRIIKELVEKAEKEKECIVCVDKKLDKINNIDGATKVLVEDNKLVKIGKGLKDYNYVECGLFHLTPDIFAALEGEVKKGDEKVLMSSTMMDNAIESVANKKEFKVLDIRDGIWSDVDTRADLLLCEEMINKFGEKKG